MSGEYAGGAYGMQLYAGEIEVRFETSTSAGAASLATTATGPRITHTFTATTTGVSSLAGGTDMPRVTHTFTATTTALGSLSGTVNVQRLFSATTTGVSSLATTATGPQITHQFTLTTTGVGSLATTATGPQVTHQMTATTTGVSSLDGNLQVTHTFTATTTGLGSLAGTVNVLRLFTATTTGVGSLAGTLGTIPADEFLLPKADLALNSWTDEGGGATDIFNSINELTPADADYIQSPLAATTSQYYEAKLEEHSDPGLSTGHTIHVRAQKTGSGHADLDVAVYEGTTLIATREINGLGTSWATSDLTLTGGEADSITDYDALRLRLIPDVTNGSEQAFPDALTVQTNLTGAVTAIDEDPDSPDANWLTAASNNVATTAHVTFPTPADALAPGAGLQEFRVLVRKFNGTGTPTAIIRLYDNGVLISSSSSFNVTSLTGQVLSYTWNASGRNPATIECRVEGTQTGGSPATRATVEVGAIEWVATTSGRVQVSWAQFELPVVTAGELIEAWGMVLI